MRLLVPLGGASERLAGQQLDGRAVTLRHCGNGQRLVTNIPGLAVQVRITDLPKRRSVRLREIRALSRLVQVPVSQLGGTLRRHRNDPLTPVKVKENVDELMVAGPRR